MAIYRLFVEKRQAYDISAKKLKSDIKEVLGIEINNAKKFLRYDVEGITQQDFSEACNTVFSEPPCDNLYLEEIEIPAEYKVFAIEYLEGQYDQRADSAEQCVQLLTTHARPKIKCADVYAISGVNDLELDLIKKFLINPVEAKEAKLSKPLSLSMQNSPVPKESYIDGFIQLNDAKIKELHVSMGFSMTVTDLVFVRDYFKSINRNPSITELKVIDTYWSDHCRHTTFLTELKSIKIESENTDIKKYLDEYKDLFSTLYSNRPDKYISLMDIATIGAKKLKIDGHLENLDISDEINACSIKVVAEIDGIKNDWLVMFKNETHNHPTEIEPFGGAATCIGGAIRDPLSGRAYVYQAMRVSGSADPYITAQDTPKGKLLQRVITKTAASGFSAYGNQIGLATGIVAEIYHNSYIAKRLECGFVVAATPFENVVRLAPQNGDLVILLGGDTGRDGCGGATGSSKEHNIDSVDKCGAEVQKGNALTERKIQRLFRNSTATKMIKKCNDFGAGGVCVAIGELSESIEIDLNAVPKKYEGLSGTEVAISESQERMAVVVNASDAESFIKIASDENLSATIVAKITNNGKLVMNFNNEKIVDIDRSFLDTNGVKQFADVLITDKKVSYFNNYYKDIKALIETKSYDQAFKSILSDLNVCSQKGLGEIFDSTIGAASVFMPFGGKNQLTPSIAMAAKLPIEKGYTDNCTVSSFGYYPFLMEQSPFTGSIYSVLASVAKLVASGASRKNTRLTFQEYFPRLKDASERWGMPTSALLGALSAQLGLKCGAIGGKDSMSGTFENIDVVPTLISFALSYEKASKLITNVIKKDEQKLYLIKNKINENFTPDFDYTCKLFDKVTEQIQNGNIHFATVTEEGGIVAAVAKSCFGNGFGFEFQGKLENYFKNNIAQIIVSANDLTEFKDFELELIGKSQENYFTFGSQSISVVDAINYYTKTLEKIFPTKPQIDQSSTEVYDYNNILKINAEEHKNKQESSLNYKDKNISKLAKPKVIIPVFPGTNCEYDTARKFIEAGAETEFVIIKNRSEIDILDTVKQLKNKIDSANILAFAGGFSGGDEPDGSGKFIASMFQNPYLTESVHDLLYNRDGLALGICNGFQALIKMSLLPYGKIQRQDILSPTLSFNTIHRHISTIVKTKILSTSSPWLKAVKTGQVYDVVISHGEGRFICDSDNFDKLVANGQIATAYCDDNGQFKNVESNVNGSLYAVEGITSPCGRVFGKMGHSERVGKDLYKNYDGNFDIKLFESGVKYFK